jgi:hypothetical protein
MKKLIITIVLALQLAVAFAENPTITKIDEKNIKLGNKYFYAFEGAKWEWTLDLLGSKSNFAWSIAGVYKITDTQNGLSNKIGLQSQCKQLGTTWYFIEHDGFLCKYEKNDSTYTITKFLPLSPKIGTKWIADSRQNIVTSVTDDFVKIEVEGDKKATSGYKLFRKNVGLYDLFEIEKNKNGQVTTKWTLTKYIPPTIETPATTTTTTSTTTTIKPAAAPVKPSQNAAATAVTTTTTVKPAATTTTTVKPAVTTTSTTTTTTTTMKPQTPVTYISSLPSKTDLIQVGSFSRQDFAEDSCRKCLDQGYQTVIYQENGLYKVLIMPGDAPDILQKIKSDIGIDGFYKQRR